MSEVTRNDLYRLEAQISRLKTELSAKMKTEVDALSDKVRTMSFDKLEDRNLPSRHHHIQKAGSQDYEYSRSWDITAIALNQVTFSGGDVFLHKLNDYSGTPKGSSILSVQTVSGTMIACNNDINIIYLKITNPRAASPTISWNNAATIGAIETAEDSGAFCVVLWYLVYNSGTGHFTTIRRECEYVDWWDSIVDVVFDRVAEDTYTTDDIEFRRNVSVKTADANWTTVIQGEDCPET